MNRFSHTSLWALALGLAAPTATIADDVSGARTLLCTTLEAQVCVESLGCQAVDSEMLNVPRFIHVDTGKRRLSTTAASGENRETIAVSMSRDGGQLILQGVEAGRAWSLFIHEATGWATFAAAAEGRSVSVFGACTPTNEKQGG
jgi:hypothetical protein